MAVETFTAPMGVLYIGLNKVGKLKNITITENYQRGDVKGIGSLVSLEKPVMGITCTFSASAFFIDAAKFGSATNDFLLGNGTVSLEQIKNTLMLGEQGISLKLFKNGALTTNAATKIVESVKEYSVINISDAFIESISMELAEGGIAGQNMSGSYLTPALMVGVLKA